MDRNQIIQLIAVQPLFEGISPEELGDLVDRGEVIPMAKDSDLIEQGKIGEAVWVLLEGKVSIIVDQAPFHDLDEPGTILGEISSVSRTPATATVKAASDLTALRISHVEFHKALSASQKLASSVLRSMAKYL